MGSMDKCPDYGSVLKAFQHNYYIKVNVIVMYGFPGNYVTLLKSICQILPMK